MVDQAEIFAIHPSWIAPVDGVNRIVENSAIVVSNGLIIDILPHGELSKKYSQLKVIELQGHILIPGLVNLHTHAAMNLMRGIADDLSLMNWLEHHIWPLEKQFVSERFVRDGTLLACAELLSGGVTCFNDMYFYPDAVAQAAMQAGIRANIGLVVIDFPSAYANDADDYLQKGLAARDQWRSSDMLTTSIAPHAPYTVCNQSFEKVMVYAEQLQLTVHTHLHETTDELKQSQEQFGMTPMQRLLELGVLGPHLTAVHGVHLSEHDVQVLNQFGCHLAHCPTSNLKLASGVAPIADVLKQGVNIGLGTDGAASNNRLDMFSEMRLAALLAKGHSGDASVLPAEQALAMATINGAKALGLEDKIGSIEVGKCADLTAVKLSDIETQPMFDPISHLIYVSGREHVSHVWVQGKLKYQKLNEQSGVYDSIERLELKEIIHRWQPTLSQYK